MPKGTNGHNSKSKVFNMDWEMEGILAHRHKLIGIFAWERVVGDIKKNVHEMGVEKYEILSNHTLFDLPYVFYKSRQCERGH